MGSLDESIKYFIGKTDGENPKVIASFSMVGDGVSILTEESRRENILSLVNKNNRKEYNPGNDWFSTRMDFFKYFSKEDLHAPLKEFERSLPHDTVDGWERDRLRFLHENLIKIKIFDTNVPHLKKMLNERINDEIPINCPYQTESLKSENDFIKPCHKEKGECPYLINNADEVYSPIDPKIIEARCNKAFFSDQYSTWKDKSDISYWVEKEKPNLKNKLKSFLSRLYPL